MPKRLVTVCSFDADAEAHLWKAKLESEGIRAIVVHDTPVGRNSPVQLQVSKRDVAKASKILKAVPTRKKIKAAKRYEKIIFLILSCILAGAGLYLLLTTPYFVGSMVLLVMGIGFIIVFILSIFLK